MEAVKLEAATVVAVGTAADLLLVSPGVRGTSCISSSSFPPAISLFALLVLSAEAPAVSATLGAPPKSCAAFMVGEVATGAADGTDCSVVVGADCSAAGTATPWLLLLLVFAGLPDAKSSDADVFEPVLSLVTQRCTDGPPATFGGLEKVPDAAEAADGDGAPPLGLENVAAGDVLLGLEKVAAGDEIAAAGAPPLEF